MVVVGVSQLRCQTVLVEQVEMKMSEPCVGLFWGMLLFLLAMHQHHFLVNVY